jgi:hypothetical protein
MPLPPRAGASRIRTISIPDDAGIAIKAQTAIHIKIRKEESFNAQAENDPR